MPLRVLQMDRVRWNERMMMKARASRRLLVYIPSAAAIALASCAKPPPPVYAPPQVIPTVMPLPPLGSAENLDLPPIDAQGLYITPNRNMTGEQALWHVRMALNVAALSCRDAGDIMGVNYNSMLRIHVLPLSRANMTADATYVVKYGADAVTMRDKIYTVVYNYFSLPPAQKAFCPVARDVVTTINGMAPEALIPYAPEALKRLEKPFQDFWAAYADYLRRLEEWRRRYGVPSVQILPCPDNDPICSGSGAKTPPPPGAPAGAYNIPPAQIFAPPKANPTLPK
ncbi:hypothetical protein BH11PSE5_BH11PSE5_23460 [soil metagenome]